MTHEHFICEWVKLRTNYRRRRRRSHRRRHQQATGKQGQQQQQQQQQQNDFDESSHSCIRMAFYKRASAVLFVAWSQCVRVLVGCNAHLPISGIGLSSTPVILRGLVLI